MTHVKRLNKREGVLLEKVPAILRAKNTRLTVLVVKDTLHTFEPITEDL